jgi:glucose/arabinose dehydrogenase
MTEVDPANSTVEITNPTSGTISVAAALPFSHRGNTGESIPGGTVFAAGESKAYVLSSPALDPSESDIWLYADMNFTNPASIITGMKYGGSNIVGRETEATTAGKWTAATDFVPLPAGGESLKLQTINPGDPANWVSGTPDFSAWIGTGTAIADSLPNIPQGNVQIGLELVIDNLASPVGIVEPPDGSGRLFVHDQGGTITIIQGSFVLPEPFAVLSGRLVTLMTGFDERGLLGLAFHPDFATNGKLYTYTSEPESGPADYSTMPIGVPPNHQSVIAEWTVDSGNPNRIDLASRRELLRVDEPQFNHDGGQLAFGPDGYLYIAFGDGGAGDDQGDGHGFGGNGRDNTTILGTVLRIDVDVDASNPASTNGQYEIPSDNPFVGSAGLDEIYAYGFRNPFRFSFDTATGDLYVADVGQNDIEELNLVTAGENYGWRIKEGSFYFDPNGSSPGFVSGIPAVPLPDDVPLVDPIAEYDHGDGLSIIGGFVYHGSLIPDLAGKYVFGEFGTGFGTPSGRLFYLDTGNVIKELQIGAADVPLGVWVKGMGQDSQGEVYVLGSGTLGPTGSTGQVYRLLGPSAAVGDWALYH